MNLTEQVAASKRLQTIWQFLFTDLGFASEPSPRQYIAWIALYGEKATEEGLSRANIWVNKVTKERRITLDDLVRYASACARNLKEEAKAKAVANG
jgi:hypothetical protein